MSLSLWVSLVAFDQAVGEVYGWFAYWPICGVIFFCVSPLCPGCGLGFYVAGFPVGFCFCWFLFRADAPFPIFIGEVLSVFRFL